MFRKHKEERSKSPETYMEWLDYLDRIQSVPENISEIEMIMRNGSFRGSITVLSSLEQQMINAINAMLTKAADRLSSTVNMCFEDNSFCRMIDSYKMFKKAVFASLFFEDLEFLSTNFRKELRESIVNQMKEFDKAFKKEMFNIAVDNPGTEFESAVTMINYIKLFN